MGDLWNLWAQWFGGHQLTGATLWGHPLFVWGRWGKALQFLAGLTVVLDLVGPERLRTLGRWLESRYPSINSSRAATSIAAIVAILAWAAFLVYVVVPSLTPSSGMSFLARAAAIAAVLVWLFVAVIVVRLDRVGRSGRRHESRWKSLVYATLVWIVTVCNRR